MSVTWDCGFVGKWLLLNLGPVAETILGKWAMVRFRLLMWVVSQAENICRLCACKPIGCGITLWFPSRVLVIVCCGHVESVWAVCSWIRDSVGSQTVVQTHTERCSQLNTREIVWICSAGFGFVQSHTTVYPDPSSPEFFQTLKDDRVGQISRNVSVVTVRWVQAIMNLLMPLMPQLFWVTEWQNVASYTICEWNTPACCRSCATVHGSDPAH